MVSKNCEAEPAGFQKRVWSAVVINLEKGVVIFVFALEKKKNLRTDCTQPKGAGGFATNLMFNFGTS